MSVDGAAIVRELDDLITEGLKVLAHREEARRDPGRWEQVEA